MTVQTRKRAYRFGALAEWFVALYLCCKGYRILARNYRCKVGEVDIIAVRCNVVVFFEVKARRHLDSSLELVSFHQQQRIVRASQFFISSKKHYHSCQQRIDLIIVCSLFKLKHIQNAWTTHQ